MILIGQFKSGIRPLWEEKANRDGGRWTVRVRRHHTDRYWENAIMAMIGEQFLVGDEICGMVLSLRYPWDQVNITPPRVEYNPEFFDGSFQNLSAYIWTIFI